MAAWKVAPALAAGCTAVLKPSELSSVTCLELADVSEEVGFCLKTVRESFYSRMEPKTPLSGG